MVIVPAGNVFNTLDSQRMTTYLANFAAEISAWFSIHDREI
jgi:hypothetical protein